MHIFVAHFLLLRILADSMPPASESVPLVGESVSGVFCLVITAPCGLRGCKNGPAPFPGRMSYKATKPCSVYLSYLSMLYYCIVVYYGTFYVLLVFVAVFSVFWLYWLNCHYLPSDWLERPL